MSKPFSVILVDVILSVGTLVIILVTEPLYDESLFGFSLT